MKDSDPKSPAFYFLKGNDFAASTRVESKQWSCSENWCFYFHCIQSHLMSAVCSRRIGQPFPVSLLLHSFLALVSIHFCLFLIRQWRIGQLSFALVHPLAVRRGVGQSTAPSAGGTWETLALGGVRVSVKDLSRMYCLSLTLVISQGFVMLKCSMHHSFYSVRACSLGEPLNAYFNSWKPCCQSIA